MDSVFGADITIAHSDCEGRYGQQSRRRAAVTIVCLVKVSDFDSAAERLLMIHGKMIDLISQMIRDGFVAPSSDLGEATGSLDMPFPTIPPHVLDLSAGLTPGTLTNFES